MKIRVFIIGLALLALAAFFRETSAATAYRTSGFTQASATKIISPNATAVQAGALSGFSIYSVGEMHLTTGDTWMWVPVFASAGTIRNYRAVYSRVDVDFGASGSPIFKAVRFVGNVRIDSCFVAATTDSLYPGWAFDVGPTDSLLIECLASGVIKTRGF